MEGSMSLKKRAVEGIVVAGSLVMMSSIAQAADVAGTQPMTVAAVTRTDLATNGTAGVVAQLNQFETSALESIGQTAGVEQMNRALVAAAEVTSVDGTQPDVTVQPTDGTQPTTGIQPGANTQSATGIQPDANTQPTIGTQPNTNTQPTDGTQPTTGTQPDANTQPTGAAGDNSTQQIGGAQAGVTAQLTDSLQAGAAGQPVDGTQVNTQSTDGTPTDVNTQPTDGTQPDVNTQPTTGTQPDVNTQPTDVNTQPTDGTQPGVNTQPVDGTQTNAVAQAGSGMSEEEQEWQNRLMADVEEFLYVRAEGSEDAEIVGKLYKGDVAQIAEVGDTWTHVESGNVDGYVMNSYCLYGSDAWNYANETFDVEAEIQEDGLRVRSGADPEASVLAAVSTGMSFPVDTSVEAVDGWVAIDYKGSTGYVSAEYVTTELALGEAVTIEEEKEQLAKEAAEAAKSAQVSSPGTTQNGAMAASVDDVTLLAALIQCEAGSESYEGQLAVGAVVMNRVRSGGYPGSIYGVIYQSGQFTPAGRGSVASVAANGPKASCMQAAQEAINGADNTGGALRFRGASSGQPGIVIGNHVFW